MAEETKPVVLRYIGGGAFVPDVPARDLTADDLAERDRKALIKSGLYEPVSTPAKEK